MDRIDITCCVSCYRTDMSDPHVSTRWLISNWLATLGGNHNCWCKHGFVPWTAPLVMTAAWSKFNWIGWNKKNITKYSDNPLLFQFLTYGFAELLCHLWELIQSFRNVVWQTGYVTSPSLRKTKRFNNEWWKYNSDEIHWNLKIQLCTWKLEENMALCVWARNWSTDWT